jgi:DNA-damage-inducible protein J
MMRTLQIRLDDTVKTEVDNLFGGLGLDTSTAVRMFFHAALEQNGIPFPVKHTRIPNADLLEAIRDTRKGENLHGPYTSAKDAIHAMLENTDHRDI